jgi:serine/threonine protein kinase
MKQASYRYLARGSYNVTLAPTDPDEDAILRIYFLHSRGDDLKVMRGHVIIDVIRRELKRKHLGPLLIDSHTKRRTIPFKNLDPEIRDIILRAYRKDEKMLKSLPSRMAYLQSMEYARGGTFGPAFGKASVAQMCTDTFALMWFLYVTQTQLGYQHRDIKPANIVIRTLDWPHTYVYKLHVEGNSSLPYDEDAVELTEVDGSPKKGSPKKGSPTPQETLSFTLEGVTSLPLVIDFDFSSLLGTNNRHRSVVGTFEFMPPEILLEMARLGTTYINTLNDNPESRENLSYDWYSLGVVLFNRFLVAPGENGSWRLFDHICKNHMEDFRELVAGILFTHFESDELEFLYEEDEDDEDSNFTKACDHLLTHICLVTSVGHELTHFPMFSNKNNGGGPLKTIRQWVQRFVLDQNDDYQILKKDIYARVSGEQLELLWRLLHPMPWERIFKGKEMWRFFAMPFFDPIRRAPTEAVAEVYGTYSFTHDVLVEKSTMLDPRRARLDELMQKNLRLNSAIH